MASAEGSGIANVTIVAEADTNIKEERAFAALRTTTDSRGSFRLKTGLANRHYRITLGRPGYFTERTTFEFPALGKTSMIEPVTMDRVPDVTGRIVACVTKTPIASAAVSTIPGVPAAQSVADANGRFVLTSVPEDSRSLQIASRDFSQSIPVALSHGGAPTQDIGDQYLCRMNDASDLSAFAPPFDVKPRFPSVDGCKNQYGTCSYYPIAWRSGIRIGGEQHIKLFGENAEGLRILDDLVVDLQLLSRANKVKRGESFLFRGDSFDIQCQIKRYDQVVLNGRPPGPWGNGSPPFVAPPGDYIGVVDFKQGVPHSDNSGWHESPTMTVKCSRFLEFDEAHGVKGYSLANVTGAPGYYVIVRYSDREPSGLYVFQVLE